MADDSAVERLLVRSRAASTASSLTTSRSRCRTARSSSTSALSTTGERTGRCRAQWWSSASTSSGGSTRPASIACRGSRRDTRVILVCNEGYASSLAAATLRDARRPPSHGPRRRLPRPGEPFTRTRPADQEHRCPPPPRPSRSPRSAPASPPAWTTSGWRTPSTSPPTCGTPSPRTRCSSSRHSTSRPTSWFGPAGCSARSRPPTRCCRRSMPTIPRCSRSTPPGRAPTSATGTSGRTTPGTPTCRSCPTRRSDRCSTAS